MSILADKYVTLFNSYCSVCVIEGFFPAFAPSLNSKREKGSFFQVEQLPKNLLSACAEEKRSIIWKIGNFACKHKKIAEILSF